MDEKRNGDNLGAEQQEQLLFMMLVQQHQQIALMGMGKLKNPATDKIERDLKSAKFAIDTLNMLDKFTKGNLTDDMKQYLTQTLTNLRLNYADEKKKGDTEGSKEGSDGKKEGSANEGKKEGSATNGNANDGNANDGEKSE